MIYYCDYEALERPRSDFDERAIPPWLNDESETQVQIPLVFTACTKLGKIMHVQNYNVCDKYGHISFLKFLDSVMRYTNHKQHTIYFHNLYYDFNIILYELMYNDFTQFIAEDITNIEYPKIELVREKIIDTSKIFIVLGENLKKAIGVNILYKGKIFKIRDTFRILSSSQDSILTSFGFKLKPKIDFDNLDVNNKNHIADLLYRCQYDVTSLALCIEKFKDALGKEFGAKGDTASSLALSAIKNMLGEDYENLFPIIANTEFEKVSRMAYQGGITQHTYHFETGIEHLQSWYIDINSSYPYTMSMDVPYGIPKEIDEFTEQYSEYIVYVDFELIKPNIPCVRCSSALKVKFEMGLESETYPSKDEFPHKFKGHLALTSWDILMLKKYYKYEMKIIKGFVYETDTIFTEFIHKLFKQKYMYKKQGNKVMELAIKLILNSLYGKFAQDLSGIVEFYTKHERLKIKAIDLKKIYCPLSSAIVSRARYNLMEVVNKNPLNFIYCDTDSMIFIDKALIDESIIGNNLGKWSYEYNGAMIDKLKVIGKKNYMVKVGEDVFLKCVGLPNDRERIYNKEEFEIGNIVTEIVDFSNFRIGYEFVIQKMHKVYGGIAMHYTTFTIKERKIMYS